MKSVHIILVIFILVQNVWTEPIYYGKISGKTKVVTEDGKQKLISINNGEYPFMVGLVRKSNDYLFCGSSLITKRVLLSAAHCFIEYKPKEVEARFGSFMRSGKDKHLEVVDIIDFIPHKDFKCKDPEPRVFDIALVVLEESVTPNKYIKIIPMTDKTTRDLFYKKNVNIIGFGYMEKHMASFHLREGHPLLLSKKDCQILMYKGTKLADSMICTLGGYAGATNKPTPGKGDSGGPVFLSNKGKYEQIGVVSFSVTYPIGADGIVKTDTNYPAVHTDVVEMKDWIEDTLDTDVPKLIKAYESKKPNPLKKSKCFGSK